MNRSLFREGLRAVFRWTFIDSPKVLRILGGGLIAIAASLTVALWNRTADTSGTLLKSLSEKGVTFNIYPGFSQDELGILTLPGGVLHVAWFKDIDGNVLSVTNA